MCTYTIVVYHQIDMALTHTRLESMFATALVMLGRAMRKQHQKEAEKKTTITQTRTKLHVTHHEKVNNDHLTQHNFLVRAPSKHIYART